MSFLVLDCEFNREWNKALIGLRFASPPSYTAVIEDVQKPDFLDYADYQRNSSCTN